MSPEELQVPLLLLAFTGNIRQLFSLQAPSLFLFEEVNDFILVAPAFFPSFFFPVWLR